MVGMNPIKQALENAIEKVGGLAAFAAAINAPSTGAVKAWKHAGSVPAAYCPAIERETKHAVVCEDLRPDVDWAVLRGTKRSRTQQTPAVAAIKTGAVHG